LRYTARRVPDRPDRPDPIHIYIILSRSGRTNAGRMEYGREACAILYYLAHGQVRIMVVMAGAALRAYLLCRIESMRIATYHIRLESRRTGKPQRETLLVPV